MKKKRFLGILLSLALVLGLMPGMSVTAYAASGTVYDAYLVTTVENKDKSREELNDLQVTFNGCKWYIIADDSTEADAGTVTLLAADTNFGVSKYQEDTSVSIPSAYSNSTVKRYLEKVVDGEAGDGKPNFKDVASAIADSKNDKMYLLDKDTAENPPQEVRKMNRFEWGDEDHRCYDWWLCSPVIDSGFLTSANSVMTVECPEGNLNTKGQSVYNILGVRPALRLDLSSVIFSSSSKEFKLGHTVKLSGGENSTPSGGERSQDIETGKAMTTVIYTAKQGFHFEAFDRISKNGITAVRTSDTDVTVSGTPTADANITIPDAVANPAATVTKKPTAKRLTYNGSAQTLVEAGTASGGTMQYALGKDTNTAPTDGWSASIPKGTNAGTYYVWYKVKGNTNHTDSATACITVKIEKDNTNNNTNSNNTNNNTNNTNNNSNTNNNNSNSNNNNSNSNSNTNNNNNPNNNEQGNTERITISTRPAAVKAKVKKKKNVTVSWKKIKKTKKTKALRKKIKSIQVQRADNKSFTQNVHSKKVGKSKTKATFKLQRKKTYYVRVRYVGADGYSKWSKVRRVKTK